MIIPFTLAALACGSVNMINQTNESWNKFDKTVLQKAEIRCGEIYTDAPCVKKFYKRPEQSYWIVCGEGQK